MTVPLDCKQEEHFVGVVVCVFVNSKHCTLLSVLYLVNPGGRVPLCGIGGIGGLYDGGIGGGGDITGNGRRHAGG